MQAQLEHLNVTVPAPKATAAMLEDIFGWRIRWQGSAKDDGYSVHVGADDSYVALYAPGTPLKEPSNSYTRVGGLNHLGVTVDDLDAVEARVKARGYTAYSHGNYEPGRRFYFRDENGLEIEVVEY
ncbi:VOC family protein [Gymnodinialimonas hymeniacidonis]|uniref:VOC family protein n=1 Tax=Gymnodinialimonas hymeniacidonis TaxID=3126508 RepID=UPI0034C6B5F3